MEHRWNSRKPIRMNVVIHSSASGLISGKTSDMSAGGIFVETAPGICIGKNSVVRVGFMVGRELKIAPAIVARTAPNGVGLMFTEAAEESLIAVEDLMAQEHRPVAAPRARTAEAMHR